MAEIAAIGYKMLQTANGIALVTPEMRKAGICLAVNCEAISLLKKTAEELHKKLEVGIAFLDEKDENTFRMINAGVAYVQQDEKGRPNVFLMEEDERAKLAAGKAILRDVVGDSKHELYSEAALTTTKLNTLLRGGSEDNFINAYKNFKTQSNVPGADKKALFKDFLTTVMQPMLARIQPYVRTCDHILQECCGNKTVSENQDEIRKNTYRREAQEELGTPNNNNLPVLSSITPETRLEYAEEYYPADKSKELVERNKDMFTTGDILLLAPGDELKLNEGTAKERPLQLMGVNDITIVERTNPKGEKCLMFQITAEQILSNGQPTEKTTFDLDTRITGIALVKAMLAVDPSLKVQNLSLLKSPAQVSASTVAPNAAMFASAPPPPRSSTSNSSNKTFTPSLT